MILTGAGSSAHAAMCAEPALRRDLGSGVEAIATTDLVTGEWGATGRREPYVLLSIARSGNSPESLAVQDGFGLEGERRGHVIITCNPSGALARAASEEDLILVMPEGTNDQGLAMTASYSCMTLAATLLACLDEGASIVERVRPLAAAAEDLLAHGMGAITDCASRDFGRAVFLGSGPLAPTARECALKLMELTAGRVVCAWESYLGLRHGPQAMIDDGCLVVCLVDDRPGSAAFPYELDLLRELREKGQGAAILAVGNALPDEVRSLATATIDWAGHAPPIAHELRPITDVVVGQLLGLLISLRLGMTPDNPSPGGIINRVVQGVRIYDPDSVAAGTPRVLYE